MNYDLCAKKSHTMADRFSRTSASVQHNKKSESAHKNPFFVPLHHMFTHSFQILNKFKTNGDIHPFFPNIYLSRCCHYEE